MHQHPRLLLVAVSSVLTLGAACGGNDISGTPSTTAVTKGSSAADLPVGDAPVDLDPADFTADIDNVYWPMEPGSRWTLREIDEEGSEVQVVITVSTETKEIANGITARIVRDTVTQDGELIEDTFDWYAQAADGTIWYLGESTAEFENGEISTTAGSFEAGVDGALPGVIMPGEPVDGMRYRQEYYEGEAEDKAAIITVGEEMVQVPAGLFDEIVMTRDLVPTEPKVQELKFFARDVGPVLSMPTDGDGGRASLVSYEPGA
jgi:hypothetical protein